MPSRWPTILSRRDANSYPTFLRSLKHRCVGLHSVDSVRKFPIVALVEYDFEASQAQESSEISLAQYHFLRRGVILFLISKCGLYQ